MPWFKVDDNLAFHHKVVAAGNGAMGLWVRAGSFCSQQLTDGFVPDHMIATLGNKRQAERLVAVGLWTEATGGYLFHEWSERQPSRESVEAEREAARQRMAERRKKKPRTSGNVRANTARTSGSVQRPRPDPTIEPTTGVVGADKPPRAELAVIVEEPTAQTLVAEWIDHCTQRPPGNVIGQVSKQIKTMLGEDISPDRIRAALVEWNTKGLHPSTLPSVVHEQANRKPRAGSSRNDDFRAMQERQMARAIEAERKMGLR